MLENGGWYKFEKSIDLPKNLLNICLMFMRTSIVCRTTFLLSVCFISIFQWSCGPSKRETILQAIPVRPDMGGWPDRLYQRIKNAEMLAINGNRPIESLKELGRLYHANGFYSEASQCYEALIKLEPESEKWPALLLAIRDWKDGENSWSSINDLWRIELYADCFDVHQLVQEATKAEQSGAVAEAIRLLNRSIQLEHPDASLHFRLGSSYLKVGESPKALESFYTSVEIDPGLSSSWYQIALIHSNAGNADEASRALVTGLSHNPYSQDLIRASSLLRN